MLEVEEQRGLEKTVVDGAEVDHVPGDEPDRQGDGGAGNPREPAPSRSAIPARMAGVSPMRISGGAQSETITFCRRWKSRRCSTAIVSSGELSATTTSRCRHRTAMRARRAGAGWRGATRARRARRRSLRGRRRAARTSVTRATSRSGRMPGGGGGALGARGPIEQHEGDAERERLLDHHHHRREALVGERERPRRRSV